MANTADKKTIQDLYESLTIIRKGTEDDFELRASADEKVWGVRLFDDNPARPTFVLYAGPDARDLACDAADYDADEEEDFSDEDDEEDDEDETDEDDEKE